MVTRSPRFPSEIQFGSFVVYPSQATTDAEKKAKTLVLDLKRNAVTKDGSVVEIIVKMLADSVAGSCLATLLDGKSVLVPMPGCAPLLKNAVWCARSICEAMVAHGLGTQVLPYMERTKTIRKSAYCALHGLARPSPREHYDTLAVRRMLGETDSVILVDDVITRGATFVGAAARLTEAFPEMLVRAFAVSHTERGMERWVSPCRGSIASDGAGDSVSRTNSA